MNELSVLGIALIIVGIVFVCIKSNFLIAGYNTLSEMEKRGKAYKKDENETSDKGKKRWKIFGGSLSVLGIISLLISLF